MYSTGVMACVGPSVRVLRLFVCDVCCMYACVMFKNRCKDVRLSVYGPEKVFRLTRGEITQL